jgi:hypothetical protein
VPARRARPAAGLTPGGHHGLAPAGGSPQGCSRAGSAPGPPAWFAT